MRLERSDAIVELGRRLVAQLDEIEQSDIVAAWMTHHVADCISAAEHAEAGSDAIARCREAVLALWAHRASLPKRGRPLVDLEPIGRVLASLDPEAQTHRYFHRTLLDEMGPTLPADTKRWIDLAVGLDYTARVLIGFTLKAAAGQAAEKAEPWAKLAEEAGLDVEPENLIIRFVLADEPSEPDAEAEARTRLQERIRRLETFANMAHAVAGDLRTRLGIPPGDDEAAPEKDDEDV